MNDTPPTLTATRSEDALGVRIHLAGELDLVSAADVTDLLEECAAGGSDLAVDLADVTFLDSTGIRALLRGAATAREQGGRLRIVAGSPAVVRVLVVAGLVDHFGLPRPE